MESEEEAIRKLVDDWLAASEAGNLDAVLKLMSDDVIFMVPTQAPFGKDAFAAMFRAMEKVKIKAQSEIQEIKVLGEWAWVRNRISITITSLAEKPTDRSGYTLTILRKQPDGRWVIYRDANLVN